MHDLSIFTSMNRIYILLFMILALKANLQAQSNGYGVRVGSGFSSQRWQGGSGRNPLLTYHADYYMDSESEKGNILYLALGYHLRGSSIYINRFVDQFGNVYSGSNFAMKFHNAVLELGAKKAKTVNNWRLIYGLGIRGEYTFKHKLEIYQGYEDFIRKFNYGFTLQKPVSINLQLLELRPEFVPMHQGRYMFLQPFQFTTRLQEVFNPAWSNRLGISVSK